MKTKSFFLTLAFSFLCLNLTAQISIPNGAINGTTNPSTGNIGIGTSTPDSKLEVVGDLKAIKGIFPGKELSGEIFTDYNDGIEKSIVFSAGKTIPGSTTKRLFTMHDLSMSSPYNLNGVFFNMRDRAGKERFNVQLYEGHGSSIDLKDHNQSELFKISGNSDGAYLQMPKPSTKVIIGGFSNNPIIGTHKFVVTGSSLIQGNIITDSSIGIGTPNPGIWKLAVNGSIRAKEIKVETGWSDFVFENNYKLPTLKEVEQHIKVKGHLKDIPSAEEVKENGIFLGEMDSKLLQKIEELTLYTIQQQKEIENLKSKIEKIVRENEELDSLYIRLAEIETFLNNKN